MGSGAGLMSHGSGPVSHGAGVMGYGLTGRMMLQSWWGLVPGKFYALLHLCFLACLSFHAACGSHPLLQPGTGSCSKIHCIPRAS